MYANLYNRICGWVFFTVGILGLFSSRIGDYAQLSSLETILNIVIGMFAMAFARSRHRYAVLSAVLLGFGLFLWGLHGMAWPMSAIGSAEPLEVLLRMLAGVWGMYIAVQDVLEWRRSALPDS